MSNANTNKFCANCGAALESDLDPALQSIIDTKIEAALSARLTDQRIVEIDIQEKVIERLKSLSKIVGIPIALLFALLGLWGIKSLSDVNTKIDEATSKALINMNNRVDGATKQAISTLNAKVDSEDAAIVKQAEAKAKVSLEAAVNTETLKLQAEAQESQKKFADLRAEVGKQAAILTAQVNEQNRKLATVQTRVNRLTVEQTAQYEDSHCVAGRCQVHRDEVGMWVFGYGHVITGAEDRSGIVLINGVPVNFRSGITEQQAKDLLSQELDVIGDKIDQMVKVKLTPNQKGALIDFVYNVGSGSLAKSSLLRKLNDGDYASVPDQLMLWDHVGGVETLGMKARRQQEGKLWNTP